MYLRVFRWAIIDNPSHFRTSGLKIISWTTKWEHHSDILKFCRGGLSSLLQ